GAAAKESEVVFHVVGSDIEVVEEPGKRPHLRLEDEDSLVPEDVGDLALRIEDVAEFARAGRADLDAGGVAARAGALDAEMALLHHPLAPGPVAQVGHVEVELLLRDRGGGEVEAPREIGAGRLAVAAADAPVVVDHRYAVRLLPGRLHRADLHAGRVLALVALDRHVEDARLRHRLRRIVVVPLVHVEGAVVGHLQHADVLDLRVAGLVVLRYAGVDALAAADAAGQVEGVDELDAVHWLVVAHMRPDPVLALHLVLD